MVLMGVCAASFATLKYAGLNLGSTVIVVAAIYFLARLVSSILRRGLLRRVGAQAAEQVK